jgi:hypothetical protein
MREWRYPAVANAALTERLASLAGAVAHRCGSQTRTSSGTPQANWPRPFTSFGLARSKDKKLIAQICLNSAGLKVSAILKLISDDRWYLDRHKGSHRQCRHPAKQGLVTAEQRL